MVPVLSIHVPQPLYGEMFVPGFAPETRLALATGAVLPVQFPPPPLVVAEHAQSLLLALLGYPLVDRSPSPLQRTVDGRRRRLQLFRPHL